VEAGLGVLLLVVVGWGVQAGMEEPYHVRNMIEAGGGLLLAWEGRAAWPSGRERRKEGGRERKVKRW